MRRFATVAALLCSVIVPSAGLAHCEGGAGGVPGTHGGIYSISTGSVGSDETTGPPTVWSASCHRMFVEITVLGEASWALKDVATGDVFATGDLSDSTSLAVTDPSPFAQLRFEVTGGASGASYQATVGQVPTVN